MSPINLHNEIQNRELSRSQPIAATEAAIALAGLWNIERRGVEKLSLLLFYSPKVSSVF